MRRHFDENVGELSEAFKERVKREKDDAAKARKEYAGFVSSSDPGVFFDPEEKMTEEHHARDADINVLLAKYENTDRLGELIDRDARFADVSDVPSYQEALERVAFAEEQFMALPAKVRERFDNDPSKFLAFASREDVGQEMVDMGLAVLRKPEGEPSPSPAAPAAPAGRGKRKGGIAGGDGGKTPPEGDEGDDA